MRFTLFRVVLAMLALLALLWLAFRFFGIQALFTDKTVNEPLPHVIDTRIIPATSTQTTPPEHRTTSTNIASETVQLVSTGNFVQGDSTYTIKGTAKIVRQGSTKTLLLTDLDVTNGPDLFVYLVSASSTENSSVKQRTAQGHFVSIAPLKGNRGNQSYILPADLDLSAYPVVSIWCRRFSRNFGSAMLQPSSKQ